MTASPRLASHRRSGIALPHTDLMVECDILMCDKELYLSHLK